MRFGLTAATAVVGVAAGAYAVARLRVVAESCDPPRFYPALGQVAGAVTQLYVDSLSGTQIPQHGRYVLVDATSARLYMMEDGRVRNSMRVIVGKPASATPALSSVLNYATVNPYWNVSPDLAQKIIAPRVLKDGYSYLTERGYEVVSKFGADAQVLAPDKVDWEAVASGRMIVKVRQRPGPANSMGQLKFDLPWVEGIYLHDTPHKGALRQGRAQSQQWLRAPGGRAEIGSLVAGQRSEAGQCCSRSARGAPAGSADHDQLPRFPHAAAARSPG